MELNTSIYSTFSSKLKQGSGHSCGSAQECYQSFQGDLLTYKIFYLTTEHSTTGRSPAELMFGRKIRTRLDLLRPNLEEEVLENQDQIR